MKRLVARQRVVLSLSVCLATTVLYGQNPGSSDTSGVAAVDVVITRVPDGPLRGLSRDDFQVFENGDVREVISLDRRDVPFGLLVIEECTGQRTGGRLSNYYYRERPGQLSPELIPFQTALRELMGQVRSPDHTVLAVFGAELRRVGESASVLGLQAGAGRDPEPGFQPDCAEGVSGSAERFEEKLAWIQRQLDAMDGNKAVVWFGPPKSLPSVNPGEDPRLRLPGDPDDVPFEDNPEMRRIRDALVQSGATFSFVLSWWELNDTYPGDPERRRRRQVALKTWAEASGGELFLLSMEGDLDSLIDRVNQRPTVYRVNYRVPDAQTAGGRSVDVQVLDPDVRVVRLNRFVPR